ncbi:MAG: L,D-transpeptidase family protein [Sulfurimonas sp.]|nr:L,D-transpeptidase family protein [Sulfurimonas sp.]
MIKSFLILVSFSIFLYSSQQIVLIIANDFNTSDAKLECFDGNKKVFNTIKVNIGKNGLGWGIGEIDLKQKSYEPLKYEGDKKAPIGVFRLTHIFGYTQKSNFSMPYLHASKNLICVDDSNAKEYNQIIDMPKNKPKSFEFMKRDDHQYELGIVVSHNKKAVKKRGSCIFLHVEKSKTASTAGCTSMSLSEIKKISFWLDESKNPILIQIPKSSAKEILKLYPELKSSELLKED